MAKAGLVWSGLPARKVYSGLGWRRLVSASIDDVRVTMSAPMTGYPEAKEKTFPPCLLK